MNMDELDDIFSGELDKEVPIGEGKEQDFLPLENDDLFAPALEEKPTSSVLDEYLKTIGITDGKIKLINEDDEEEEVSFYDLTKEEQLEILSSSTEEPETDLDESEVGFLNQLRENNMSVEEFLESYKNSIIESLGVTDTESYDIDNYDDQELFLLDLKNKYDLSDEELEKELEKELKDETLFKKKVDVLRKEYKELEDQYKEAQQQESLRQREEEYNQFSEKMVEIAVNTPEFYGIELEDDEKNEVLSFLLDQDENGASQFYKTLSDPNKLYEAAWFLRYGKESFDALKNAYESEIAKLKKQDKPTVVRKPKPGDTNKEKNIHDLF